ncbi:MAG TPA: hypothetical protein VK759_06515 [Rhizomicrobium sp.]|nr:hypothetical protein [Rhizomicrobium sp.]
MNMIPIGYMLKKIMPPPDWLKAPQVEWVYSVSNCVSKDFLNYIPFWKHNGWWMFDNPTIVQNLAKENGVNLDEQTLLYYEAFESEFDENENAWQAIAPQGSFHTDVQMPGEKLFRGYDIVTFSVHTSPECSPLSCNMLASEIPTNRFCLIDDFQSAFDIVKRGLADNAEPGPDRIIAVYTVSPG